MLFKPIPSPFLTGCPFRSCSLHEDGQAILCRADTIHHCLKPTAGLLLLIWVAPLHCADFASYPADVGDNLFRMKCSRCLSVGIVGKHSAMQTCVMGHACAFGRLNLSRCYPGCSLTVNYSSRYKRSTFGKAKLVQEWHGSSSLAGDDWKVLCMCACMQQVPDWIIRPWIPLPDLNT